MKTNEARYYPQLDEETLRKHGPIVAVMVSVLFFLFRLRLKDNLKDDLISHKLTRDGLCQIALQELATRMHVPYITIRRSLEDLLSTGYVRIKKQGRGSSHLFGFNIDKLPSIYKALLQNTANNLKRPLQIGDETIECAQIERRSALKASEEPEQTALKASDIRMNEQQNHKNKTAGDFSVHSSLGAGNGNKPKNTPEDALTTQAVSLMKRAACEFDLFQSLDAKVLENTLLQVCAPKFIARYKTEKPNLSFGQWVKVAIEACVEEDENAGNLQPHYFVSDITFEIKLPAYKQWLRDNVGGIVPAWPFWKDEMPRNRQVQNTNPRDGGKEADE